MVIPQSHCSSKFLIYMRKHGGAAGWAETNMKREESIGRGKGPGAKSGLLEAAASLLHPYWDQGHNGNEPLLES